MMDTFKCGFVAVVGPTNSGKSTLLNAIIGEKVSIVSPKPQTTYHAIRGILQSEHYQVVFVDTPGFQRHRERVAKLLNQVADKNAKDCDIALWVFDVSNPRVLGQLEALKDKIAKLKNASETLLVLNKVDAMAKPALLPLIETLSQWNLFSEIIPLSARTGDGVDRLVQAIVKKMPEGPALFDNESVTDRTQAFLISEFVREKIYRSTGQEVPYSVWVELEEAVDEGKCPTYRAVIHVDSQSRKGILIGKGGKMLKEIGTQARRDIEKHLGHQICLKLFVDVQSEWKEDAHQLNRYLELT